MPAELELRGSMAYNLSGLMAAVLETHCDVLVLARYGLQPL
jgi:hypothetical protein